MESTGSLNMESDNLLPPLDTKSKSKSLSVSFNVTDSTTKLPSARNSTSKVYRSASAPVTRHTTLKTNRIQSATHHGISTRDDPFAYRHFHNYFPTCNKIFTARIENKNREMHLEKLRNAKSTIDNSKPTAYPHLDLRLKQMTIQEDRRHDIERTNRILLDRIATQMERSQNSLSNRAPTEPRGPSSLSCDKRRRDSITVAIQNGEIFNRIQNKVPYYQRQDWLLDRRQNLGYLKNISQYPKQYYRIIEQYDSKFKHIKRGSWVPPNRPKYTTEDEFNMDNLSDFDPFNDKVIASMIVTKTEDEVESIGKSEQLKSGDIIAV
ncbi:KIAA1430-like protein-domain-containing protein [Globomyces pollinis-pini]|nr:KIAA1430-like protein-domain-containing protein [Globomyces pollinis-pini]